MRLDLFSSQNEPKIHRIEHLILHLAQLRNLRRIVHFPLFALLALRLQAPEFFQRMKTLRIACITAVLATDYRTNLKPVAVAMFSL